MTHTGWVVLYARGSLACVCKHKLPQRTVLQLFYRLLGRAGDSLTTLLGFISQLIETFEPLAVLKQLKSTYRGGSPDLTNNPTGVVLTESHYDYC